MIHVGTPYTASTLDSSRPSKRPRCNDEESGEEATSSASEPALPHTPKRQRQVDASAPAAVRPVPTLVPTPVFSSATAPPSPRASLASPQSSPAFAFLPVPAPAPAPAPSPTGPAATVVLVPTAVPALVLISAHVPPPASTSTPAPTQAPTRLQSGRCAYYLSTPAFTSLTQFVQRANTAGIKVTRSDARNIPRTRMASSGRMMVRALRTHRVWLASSSASRVCGQGARVANAPCSLPWKQLLGPFLRSTSQPNHIISAAFCAASRGTLYDPVQGTYLISYSLLLCPCLYRSSSPLFEVCRR
jgi:hypothetical protein